MATDVNDSLAMEPAENIHHDNFTVQEIKHEALQQDYKQGFGKQFDEHATEDLFAFEQVRLCNLHAFFLYRLSLSQKDILCRVGR